MNKPKFIPKTNEQGIASLLFSMIMMIVISLIVLSFAQIARSGQREALDSQLSTQAFYAAESGVNDITKVITALVNQGKDSAALTNSGCGLTGAYKTYYEINNISPQLSDGVSYTCVKVNPTPSDLKASVSPSVSQVLNIQPEGNASVGNMDIIWYPSDPNNATYTPDQCPATGANTTVDNWTCPYAMLRFDLVNLDSGYSRDALTNNTMAVFAVPSASAPTNTNLLSGANVVSAGCDAARCKMTITGLGGKHYAMRLTSKYLKADSITLTPSGNKKLVGGQAIIDVTGKAQDVLRRVQVRLSLNNSGAYADNALSTQDSICKRFAVVGDGTVQDDAECPAMPSPAGP